MATSILILEDAKWLWKNSEIKECCELYRAGLNVYQIAERMGESVDNVALLVIHLGQKGKLERKL